MDGASKFVRGESIAGIIITLVNMIVGFIVGIVQHNMDASTSAKTFTLLAVGDGLVTAIPSLMISTAAGLIVTRATSDSNLGSDIVNQVRSHPRVFYWSGALILALALFPGFPKIPFFALAFGMIYIGKISADRLEQEQQEAQRAGAQVESADDKATNDLDNLMKVDALSVEVGHALVSLIDPSEDGEVVERIQSLRKQFAQDLGIIIPQVQLRDNLQLDPGHYAILIKGNKVSGGQLMTDYYLAMDPGTVEVPIHGETIPDPVYGMPAMWVHSRNKDDAVFRGYTVVNCSTVIATHLTKILREHASELITRQDIQYLVDKLKETNPKVVDEVLSAERLALGDVVKVFQNLLKEDVSVKDILTLFETLADHAKYVKNPDILSEMCRKALGRTIVSKLLDTQQQLLVLVFDRVIEDLLAAALVVQDNGATYLNFEARMAQDLLNKISKAVEAFNTEGVPPVLLVSARIRQPLYKITSRYLNTLALISYDEVPSDIQIKTLDVIS